MSKKKSIIVASAHLMNGPLKLGSSHLARCFAEAGYRTLYLNAPTSPLHLALPRSHGAARQRLAALAPRPEPVEGLTSLSPLTLLPHYNVPLFRSRLILENWPLLTVPQIAPAIAQAGFSEPDVVLFDSIMFWPLIRRMGWRSIYRLADRIDAFPVNTSAMIEMHETALRDADLVIYTACDLAPTTGQRRGPSRLISNGVDYEHFSKPQERPKEYRDLCGPIAIYVGAVSSWFDMAGLSSAAKAHPQVNFVIVGPIKAPPDLAEARRLPNVHFLGARPHGQVPAYMQHADIGLIPFDLAREGRLLDTVCPLKLFEYLASGLSVISYGGREVVRLRPPAVLYDPRPGASSEHGSLADAIACYLSEPVASPGLIQEQREFAQRADWFHRMREIEIAMRALRTVPDAALSL